MPEETIKRTASTSSKHEITQDALDRLEANLSTLILSSVAGLKEVIFIRLADHERRLNELNNSHDKATEAKRLTDEAATKIQERAVSKSDLQMWKDEVNRALTLQTSAVTAKAEASAKMWSLVMAISVIVVNVLIRFLLPTP